ncbi:fatty acid synthase [Diachasma alloeum]|uniref:fatty acid synthase n=1 Tax=Diachasma alloeum TaxID=454923 RepID=UPI0007383ED8|nr:fatty acid synthase [Diachasma alloeum]
MKAAMNTSDEIVISGISGRFPESNNFIQFRDNLMNKVDLITDDDRRWVLYQRDLPRLTGKVNNAEKFDAKFFDCDFKQSHTMDPQGRMLLEHAYEAIVDAGVNPENLRDTNTGVFVATCFVESEYTWIYEKHQGDGLGMIGTCKSMLANRLSRWLGVKGPSYNVDSACSSSLYAMEHAYSAIRTGLCDNALVCASNLCLHPNMSMQYARLGVLSLDGHSKSFDNGANGYVRSETIAVAYLQKAMGAKRIYATVVHVKTNCDGFKPQGITFPSSQIQSLLLKDIYKECKVPPSSVAYFEAHGTGTKVGDPEELKAIASVFHSEKEAPLKIGAVKSNMGHAEAAAGMAQISKIIIAYESGTIPPNLHYKEPREGVKALQDGRLKVITEPTPWNGGYVGISSFGFGGANAHVVLKSNSKEKINGGAPQDDLPRLVVASGRTEDAVGSILTDVENRPVDIEYIRLLHDLYAEKLSRHPYRGYTIVGGCKLGKKLQKIKHYPGIRRPVWFVFSGVGSQWLTMRPSLLRFQVFANTINRYHASLKSKGIDIYSILMNPDGLTSGNIVSLFVGITAMQIGLVDLLTTLGIFPDGMIGHAFGELGCAYADGSLTAEQTILAAYSLALVLLRTESIDISMATVSLGSKELENLCPPDIEVVWHNSPESSTISGPTASIEALMARLTAVDISTQKIPCSTIVYNRKYMAEIGPKLLAYLKEVIPQPKVKSSRWFSTSIPESQWNSSPARLSSAEYHSNNFLSPILFAESSVLIPEDAVIIEITPHNFLQDLLDESLPPQWTLIPLIQDGQQDDAEIFLQAIGELYDVGLQPEIWKLYPEVKFPVSRGTPMISPLIKWDHSEDWFVSCYKQKDRTTSGERQVELSISDEEFEYMAGHIIDGRNVLPATGYLTLVWETVGLMRGLLFTEMSIVFEDVDFLRATTISEEPVDITIMIQTGTGRFEIIEDGVAVVTGVVRHTNDAQLEQIQFPIRDENEPEELDTNDLYKDLRIRGYQYSGLFRAIKSATLDGTRGTIRWNNNWVTFMDNMLQMMLLGLDTRSLVVATRIQKLVIDTREHSQQIQSMSRDKPEFTVFVNRKHDTISSGGIQIRGLKSHSISRRRTLNEPVLETYQFVAHRDRAEVCLKEAVCLATHLAVENQVSIRVKVLESLEIGEMYPPEELLSYHIAEILADLPMIQSDLHITTPQNLFTKELPHNINISEPKRFTPDTNALILAGRDLLTSQKTVTLTHILPALSDGGFVFTIESSSLEEIEQSSKKYGLHIISEKVVDRSTFWVLRKIDKIQNSGMIIQVDDRKFTWVDTLKAVLQAESERENSGSSRVLLISDKMSENGLLGLVKCLRRESGGKIIRGVLIQDQNTSKFSFSDSLYADQLNLDLAINVLRPGGIWGSYRHLPLPTPTPRLVHHVWAKQLVRGDLSTFRWMEGPITLNANYSDLVRVVYSSINFKDIMLATGKLTADNFDGTRIAAECLVGFEYAGITTNDFRVMGMVSSCAITNILHYDSTLMWTVPDSWTLEEAATVPCAYATCCYALYFHGKMKKGDKILIHAGSGGVGQAAINLALSAGCEIFTTVGTGEKRAFIQKTFPQIPEDHIGNSRDSSFEQLVMNKTNGKGVDIVLNSLADDKLQASVRCLAEGGKFLEIGKFDIANNSILGMSTFSKGISFYGIMLDKFLTAPSGKKRKLHRLVQRLLDERIIKPLNFTIFNRCDIESAFKYMAAGKHIGKVILKIQDETNLGTLIPALPRYYCRTDRSYIILGGLGGFGLELADWLILRGAQYIILTSRGGIKNGYQRMRIKRWKNYGVKVTIIARKEASNPKDCEDILSLASKQAPVDAIYNLAVVLKDGLFENQTPKTFEEPFKAKAWSTKNLDKLSRRMCPKLRHFVVFSSVSCGRGNAGLANYGMSNAIMERICEKRASESLPALAIQWGAIGDVGIVVDMQNNDEHVMMGGTLQQRIASCLHELDGFLNQKCPVVASMVVTENRAGSSGCLNIADTVLNIMGIKDLKSVGVHTSLAELGMDSMMAMEIKQTLEREFEIFLTAQNIRDLTFAKLIERDSKNTEQEKTAAEVMEEEAFVGMKFMIRLLGKEEAMKETCLELYTKRESGRPEVFLIPGFEGCGAVFMNLAKNITAFATCLQLNNLRTKHLSIPDMADELLPYILKKNDSRRDFVMVGYSYGALITIELVRKLEAESFTGKVILIDGAPLLSKVLRDQQFVSNNDNELQTKLLLSIANRIAPKLSRQLFVQLKRSNSWEEKLDAFTKFVPAKALKISSEQQRNIWTCIYNRTLAFNNYDISSFPLLRSTITLLKPSVQSVKNLPADYDISKITRGKVKCHILEGDHVSILDNPNVTRVINGERIEDVTAVETITMQNGKILTPMYEASNGRLTS